VTDHDNGHETLALYLSQNHPCPYLPDRTAKNLFIDPAAPKDPLLYSFLIERGFRRSGEYIYRPHCDNCQACIPTRLPVARFHPRRSQRRVWRQNQQTKVISQPAEFNTEQYDLYCRYMAKRHPGGEMADASAEEFIGFLSCSWSDTQFFEFRLDDQLLAVAVTDLLPRGLSAVYTFYEPDLPKLGLGTCAILWQIRHAQQIGLPWLYLGYWVPGCNKMAYKQEYRPLQVRSQEQWQEAGPGETISIPEIPDLEPGWCHNDLGIGK